MKRFSTIVLLCTLSVACTRDPEVLQTTTGQGEDRDMVVMLDVNIPKDKPSGSTRAISGTEENTVQTLDILVFSTNDGSSTTSNERFLYSAVGTLSPNSTPGSATQQFVASLRIKPYGQRIVVITNAHQQVSDLLAQSASWPGTDKDQMLSQLKFKLPGGQDRWNAVSSSNYTAIPMWGQSASLESITSTTKNLSSTVNLMRMVACIDVKLDTSVSGLTGQFKLKSVNLYNTNTGGNIVPTSANLTGSGATAYATSPTIPSELQPSSARNLGPIAYSDFTSPGVTDVSMIGAIYTFETASGSVSTDADATCLVVGGLYGTDTTPTYYRVELFASGTQNRLNILRNYRYVVNIVAVQGRGHATVAEAFSSKAVNMTANVLTWNQPALSNVVFDGQYSLATDKSTVTLYSNQYNGALATGDNVVKVYTDVPAGWTVASTSASWVTVTPTTGSANATTSMTINAEANTGAERTATVTLSANRLRLPITITQRSYPAISLNIVNSGGQEIQQLVFSSAADATPTAQTFTVNWLPATNPVSVSVDNVGQYEFPNPGGNPAVADGAPYANMVWPSTTGTYTFTVAPPAITSAQLTANPFIKKTSTFAMTVSNGYTTMVKNITLTQLYYQLFIEDATRNFVYPMGRAAASSGTNPGAVYNYSVRSNTNWTISNIVQTPRVSGTNLLTAVSADGNVYTGATGTPNTTPGGGYLEKLTTNPSARGNSGYADVTYSPVSGGGQFTAVTKRLFFPAAPFSIYGIAASTGTDPTPFNIYGNGTSKEIMSMVTAAVNYGTTITGTPGTPSSTVFVPQITVGGVNITSRVALTTADIAAAANYDMLFISADATYDSDVAGYIIDNFAAKGKPVVLLNERDTNFNALWTALQSRGTVTGSVTKTDNINGAGPVYQFFSSFTNSSVTTILNGPFGDMRGKYWGVDGTGNQIMFFSNSADVVSMSNGTNQSGTTDSPPSGYTMDNGSSAFKITNLPIVYFPDNGFMITNNTSSSTNSPAILYDALVPNDKPNYGNGSTKRSVSNAKVIANIITWAIQRRATQ